MDQSQRDFILRMIDQGKDLTVATVRPDGYPQATTVSYANDGMTIYIGVGKSSQKASNIRQCNKVSLTINADYADWNHIKGLSIGGTAEIVTDPAEINRAGACMIKRFPQLADFMNSPQAADFALVKVMPQVISLLDYEKGFGHTELVTV
jgi:general stress protein 26